MVGYEREYAYCRYVRFRRLLAQLAHIEKWRNYAERVRREITKLEMQYPEFKAAHERNNDVLPEID